MIDKIKIKNSMSSLKENNKKYLAAGILFIVFYVCISLSVLILNGIEALLTLNAIILIFLAFGALLGCVMCLFEIN